jgi:TP901 family phage tail tape measure protein
MADFTLNFEKYVIDVGVSKRSAELIRSDLDAIFAAMRGKDSFTLDVRLNAVQAQAQAEVEKIAANVKSAERGITDTVKREVVERTRARKNESDEQVKAAKNAASNPMNIRRSANLRASVERYYLNNQKNIDARTAMKGQFDELRQTVAVDLDKESLDGAKTQFAQLRAEAVKSGVEVDTLREKFMKLFKTQVLSQISSRVIASLGDELRRVAETVKELDGALVDLQIATGSSRAEAGSLLQSYSALGKELGASTADTAAAADAWLRQGYSVRQTQELIKASTYLSKLGQMEAAEATTALTSALNGYGESAASAGSVVDKLVAVDMQYAVSAGGIAEAMSRTAASANVAGISMDKLIGIITAVKEVTQAGNEEVGNFAKTLASRMGYVKAGMLADPESGEDLSNVETALKAYGIQLRDESGEFRNFGVVLDEVAGKWGALDSVGQRALTTAFAGTYNAEKFIVLMENYGKALDASAVSANAAGTAQDKYANAVLPSVEAAQGRAAASFEAFSSAVFSSDMFVGFLDGVSGMLGAFTKIADSGYAIVPILGAAAAALSALKVNFVEFTSLKTVEFPAINGLKELLSGENLTFKGFKEGLASPEKWQNVDMNLLREYAASLRDMSEAVDEGFTARLRGASGETQALADGMAAGAISIQGVEKTAKGAALATKALAVASGLASMAVQAIGGALLGMAISAAVKAITSWVNRVEEATENLKKLKEEAAGVAAELAETYAALRDKAKEMSGLDASTYTGAERLAVLQSETDELRAQLPLLKMKKELADLDLDVQQTENRKTFDNEHWGMKNRWADLEGFNATAGILGWDLLSSASVAPIKILTGMDSIEEVIKTYSDLQIGLQKVRAEQEKTFSDERQKEIDAYNLALDHWLKILSTAAKEHPDNDVIERIAKATTFQFDAQVFKKFNDAVNKLNEEQRKSLEDALASNNLPIDDAYALFGKELADELQAAAGSGANAIRMLSIVTGNAALSAEEAADAYETFLNSAMGAEFAKLGESQRLALADAIKQSGAAATIEDLAAKSGVAAGAIRGIVEQNGGMENFRNIILRLAGPISDAADAAANLNEKAGTLGFVLEKLNGVESAVSKMSSALSEFQGDGKVTAGTLAELQTAFADVEGIEGYVNAISKAKNTAELQAVLQNLASAYAATQVAAMGLTDKTAELVVQQLRNIGVTNAEDVALQTLALEKLKAMNADMSEITAGEADEMLKLAESTAAAAGTLALFYEIKALAADAEYLNSADSDFIGTEEQKQKYLDNLAAKQNQLRKQAIGEIPIAMPSIKIDVPSASGGGSGSSADKILEAWQKLVDDKKHALEMDEITQAEYMAWLEASYKKQLSDARKYAEEYEDIEEELYKYKREAAKQAWDDALAEQKHALKMEQMSEEEYYAWLEEAYPAHLAAFAADARELAQEERAIREELYEWRVRHEKEVWDDALAEQKHALKMGRVTEGQYYKWLRSNYKSYLKDKERYLEEYRQIEEEYYEWVKAQVQDIYNEMKNLASSAKSLVDGAIGMAKSVWEIVKAVNEAVQNVISLRIAAITERKEAERDAFNEQLERLKAYYDKQKQLMRDAEDERKYLEEQAEKRKSVSDLEREIAILSTDNSGWAKRRILELQEELAGARKELTDFERDHALDETESAMDEAYEREEKAINGAVEEIERFLSDQAALRNQAIKDLFFSGMDSFKAWYEVLVQDFKNNDSSYANTVIGKIDTGIAWFDRFYGLFGAGMSMVETLLGGFSSVFNIGKGLFGLVGSFAGGTQSAPRSGVALTDENGTELKMLQSGKGSYTVVSKGDKVFDAAATDFLYKFAKDPKSFLRLPELTVRLPSVEIPQGLGGASFGDVVIHINGSADEKTVSQIRREIRAAQEDMLRGFKRLALGY